MAVFRLILLVVVLGGLTLLLVQNWTPVLSLVFLGMRSKPIPLALWILFSTAAGAFTTVFITSLFNLSTYFAQPRRQASPRSPANSTRTSQTRREEPVSRPYSPPYSSPSDNKTESTATSDLPNDWETDTSTDDWDFEEEQAPTPNPNTQVRDSYIYERQQEPKSSYKSDSVYSYSYREPKNSGVGKTESVYDADYRVIIPPYQPQTPTQAENNQAGNNQEAEDDDWGFLEDDFEDEDKRPRR